MTYEVYFFRITFQLHYIMPRGDYIHLPCATKTLPTRKNSTRIIFEITVTAGPNGLRPPVAGPCYLLHLLAATLLLYLPVAACSLRTDPCESPWREITVTRFAFFRINFGKLPDTYCIYVS